MNPMLAKPYEAQPISGWLMSEKLDGVRALWDGARLVSRNGNEFAAPAWFIAALPAGMALDGELYMGRGLTDGGIPRFPTFIACRDYE